VPLRLPQFTLDDYETAFADRHLLQDVVAKWAKAKPEAAALESATSLAAARQSLETAYANAIGFLRSHSAEDLAGPLPPGPVMGGQPTSEIVWAMVEHTAHHRGALTVYSRLLGKVPPMPYGG